MKRIQIKLLVQLNNIQDVDTLLHAYKGKVVDKHIVSIDLAMDDVAHFEETIHNMDILKLTGGIEYS